MWQKPLKCDNRYFPAMNLMITERCNYTCLHCFNASDSSHLQNGFRVKVQSNVHRKNVQSMLATAILLNDIGVEEMRIICTTESPRWVQNAGDACLTFEKYFDTMLEFIKDYVKTNCNMEIF